jgi:p-cymene monooxygenase electron transfer component
VTLISCNRHFEVGKNETVLERALKENIPYPHDCTVGTCGTCRTKLCEGRVEAITPFGYALSKEELDAGYILACQALAKTDLVLDVEIAPSPAAPVLTQAAQLLHTETLTHDIKRVTWKVGRPLQWRAGQYVNVKWNGGTEHRSYSFATAPASGGASEISTFIRHVPGGSFTDLLFKGDLDGIAFELDGPHGNFWLRDGNGAFVCVAGGSGLAPILSLLQDAAVRGVRRDCIFLFGARAARDLYALDEIEQISGAWAANFEFWPVLSEEEAEGARHGLVTNFIAAALARLGAGPQAYLCGPPGMIDAGVATLTDLGIGLSDIHYDKFTDASTRKQ